MHNSLKIIKTLLYSYSALHVSGNLAPIIRSLLILHIQPPVTVCRWVLMILRLLCIWLVFYSLLSSLMHGTMNLKLRYTSPHFPPITLDYTSLNFTTPNYTSLSVSILHFLSFTLHYPFNCFFSRVGLRTYQPAPLECRYSLVVTGSGLAFLKALLQTPD
jgi:hypothetical protein